MLKLLTILRTIDYLFSAALALAEYCLYHQYAAPPSTRLPVPNYINFGGNLLLIII